MFSWNCLLIAKNCKQCRFFTLSTENFIHILNTHLKALNRGNKHWITIEPPKNGGQWSELHAKHKNTPFSYSRYWTGTSLQMRLMRGVKSLHSKLVPVQYREHEYWPYVLTWQKFSVSVFSACWVRMKQMSLLQGVGDETKCCKQTQNKC